MSIQGWYSSPPWHQGPDSFHPYVLPSSTLAVDFMLAPHGPKVAAAAPELTSACQAGNRRSGKKVGKLIFSQNIQLTFLWQSYVTWTLRAIRRSEEVTIFSLPPGHSKQN